ncbi:MAG: N-acetyltransferase [Marivibrio sp.]|uniref:GNAT family N-acetyltransferase n=1 Tax=Marivibrio sp. TaxID=2039719 RepID=UPI0032EE427F
MTAIRSAGPTDADSILALYPLAFPAEDLTALVQALLTHPDALSLIAAEGDAVVGHIVFTRCPAAGGGPDLALLGPLCVTPARQRAGIGTALTREGVRRLTLTGVGRVLVLGDPAYYARAGFAPETAVAPPYPLPDGWAPAWRGLALGGAPAPRAQTLQVPEVWRDPALWGG